MSVQITESDEGYTVTEEMARIGGLSGVWTLHKGGKAHPVFFRGRSGKPGDGVHVSLCGYIMREESFETALPATADCKFCRPELEAHLRTGAEREARESGEEKTSEERPASRPVTVLPVTPEGVVTATQEEPAERPPFTAADLADAAYAVEAADTGVIGDGPDEVQPFRVTQVMVNEGMFIGAATVREGGKVHPVILAPNHITGQSTLCGVSVGTQRVGHVVTWQELPAAVDCGTCLPKARELAGVPANPGEAIDRLLVRFSRVSKHNDELLDEVRNRQARSEELEEALQEGVVKWRQKQRDMGRKIGVLERQRDELEKELAALKRTAGPVRALPALEELREENDRLRALAARWRGLTGVLAWKYGGPGTAEKTVALSAMEWAAAYGALFEVSGQSLPEIEGRFEITVAIRKPGDAGVSSVYGAGEELTAGEN